MNYDQLESVDGSLTQHGKYNDRLYIMKLAKSGDISKAISKIEGLAKRKNYGKIFAKVSNLSAKYFGEGKYSLEAKVPNLYNGSRDGYFFSKYLDDQREEIDDESIASVVKLAEKKKNSSKNIDEEMTFEELSEDDVDDIVKIYKVVFKTYPFPIFDPKYVLDSLKENVRIFGAKVNGKIIAVSSCEIDYDAENVEMTDFATLPEYRGKGISHKLLSLMDLKMKLAGIKTAYTIARSKSFGMNITFSRRDYSFAGTLKNNTNISGSIESMNVWYKRLSF
ncbi:putative beta-lysine N-acetyltransferase [Halobacteriovorax marinus]|uniref:Acetyltransferase n=1 Tax=Halobacteriovorax marinus (strain ATCC BAA-682 / DSM 15412 / SJ) TaxID=862908 RepID=E1WX94_HALMS|nr:putative beta-lysine N-acetyltransferase [Halobacteriovorax marinus]ATH07177.1 putative beta-lysine N-acetyltransferase [Halobacteriovorax marinus]CBW25795.1 putative acetyltransferase [Halobacteriovorax marinus SJ]